jgi:hypothetical protein
MKIRIPYPLSAETDPEYVKALEAVESSKNRGGKVVDLERQQVGPGQFAGVIVMDEPVVAHRGPGTTNPT